MISLVVVGAAGRMGRAVLETAGADTVFHVKGGVDPSPRPGWAGDLPWGEDLSRMLARGDVVIEFGGPEAARQAARACEAAGAGLVSGSTGLTQQQQAAVDQAATQVAVLRAANFSLGVLALRQALQAALPGLPRQRSPFRSGPILTGKSIRADCKPTLSASNASWAAMS